MGIWESEYYINSDPGPAHSIWNCRPWHPTNHTPWPFWKPAHGSQQFKNYLRPQFTKVAVDGKHSSPRELKYGVPQRSCSGANLSTCYCSLIKDQIDNSITLTAFADGHSICNNFKAGEKEQEHNVKTYLEKTFTHLKQWMDTMHLKLNPDKTEYILFGSWQQLKKTSQELLDTQGDPIAVSKVVRYLGGFLDQNLNFKKHIIEKTKKTMAYIIKICAIRKYLTVQSCTTLILMLCITQLDYANAMLYGLPSSTLRNYQTIQNTCTKLVLNKNRYSSSSWALKKLHWLPIQQRREHKILMTTFKCITGITPKYLHDLISIKITHGTTCDPRTLASYYTHHKWSTRPLQHGPSCTLLQYCGTNYQDASEIHQTWTFSKRGWRHIYSAKT